MYSTLTKEVKIKIDHLKSHPSGAGGKGRREVEEGREYYSFPNKTEVGRSLNTKRGRACSVWSDTAQGTAERKAYKHQWLS